MSVIPKSPSADDYSKEADRPLISAASDPIELFQDWMAEARAAELNDSNAMSLATVDADGMPDVRMVLLKGVSTEGFCFYTNLESTKGTQLSSTPKAALGFHWKSLRRQVRVRGAIKTLPDADADAYFASRAKLSRISALASDQSRPLEDRAVFKARVDALMAKYDDDDAIPRPAHWGGFRVVPESIEFWQDQSFRMHDRLMFARDGEGWTTTRLYP